MVSKHGKLLLILVIVNIVLFTYCSEVRKGSKLKSDFEIFFGSGFENDKTSLQIDSMMVFGDEILNTDFSTGITELQVICRNGILSTNKEVGQSKPWSNHTRTISCAVIVNQMAIEVKIDLKKGRFVLFEKNKGSSKIEYRQFKQRPIFE